MKKKNLSWGWVVFWLIIFWPVGLYFLIKKLPPKGKAVALSVIAWFFIVIGGLGAIGIISGEAPADNIIPVLISLIVGVLLLRKAKRVKKTRIRYEKYIDLIINQNVRSIDYIASEVGLPYNLVIKDLQNMIDLGYLKDAYIQTDDRKLVFRQLEQQVFTIETADENKASAQTISVRCSGCGASNVVVVGKVTECEYCGSPINV